MGLYTILHMCCACEYPVKTIYFCRHVLGLGDCSLEYLHYEVLPLVLSHNLTSAEVLEEPAEFASYTT